MNEFYGDAVLAVNGLQRSPSSPDFITRRALVRLWTCFGSFA
jgi:hypothetical protein